MHRDYLVFFVEFLKCVSNGAQLCRQTNVLLQSTETHDPFTDGTVGGIIYTNYFRPTDFTAPPFRLDIQVHGVNHAGHISLLA